ncbi:MAG TPA: cytochrome c-type biogenesis protein [Caulobacterales bacterium]|nr:cytochrome c-type biogenesis protein [Caulobacterales bacterium]
MSLLLILALATAPMADPTQEARAQALENEIRCVVCQNEPISQSTADIAVDMRRLVRERIAAGDSDEQIRSFFRERYGDFVLLRPPMDPRTWALWAAPLALAAFGLIAVWSSSRRKPGAEALAPEEGER